jgi:cysteine synthase
MGLFSEVVDEEALDNAVSRFRDRNILVPTFAEMADPSLAPASVTRALGDVGPDDPDPLNLWRVHWYNGADRTSRVEVPQYLRLTGELTGVDATIILILGNRFPMIRAHKVQAAFACLAPRIVTGTFDPTANRAIWPSTGNYARGGVAISRIMDCRGVAVLPEGMSQERFDWLDEWTEEPDDIIRTTGTESNVKEIYDACKELAKDSTNVILNQFSEFANHLGHYRVTGRALEHAYEDAGRGNLVAYVSASGSAGTLGAGDYLKEKYGTRIVPVEALECPTMLYNGYGEHNIQGIGDKHIPLIHNVTNSDDVVGISDRATDHLYMLFNTDVGKKHLIDQGVDPATVDGLRDMGLSSIANLLAAIKVAKYHGYGSNDVIVTVATDGAEMYQSEMDKFISRDHDGEFDTISAAGAHARFLEGADTEHVLELGEVGRRRIFNLGYYTWVEQQGVEFEDFEARRDQSFWRGLHPLIKQWDTMIDEFNGRTGATYG